MIKTELAAVKMDEKLCISGLARLAPFKELILIIRPGVRESGPLFLYFGLALTSVLIDRISHIYSGLTEIFRVSIAAITS